MKQVELLVTTHPPLRKLINYDPLSAKSTDFSHQNSSKRTFLEHRKKKTSRWEHSQGDKTLAYRNLTIVDQRLPRLLSTGGGTAGEERVLWRRPSLSLLRLAQTLARKGEMDGRDSQSITNGSDVVVFSLFCRIWRYVDRTVVLSPSQGVYTTIIEGLVKKPGNRALIRAHL